MGKAIILSDSDFSAYNLGQVHRVTESILPDVSSINQATEFRVEKNGILLTDVSWSISDSTLASLVSNQDGTCVVTPLIVTSSSVTLTAHYMGGELSLSFVATIRYIDITELCASYFLPRYSLGSFYGINSAAITANNKRCCIKPFSFSSIGVLASSYSTVEVTIKSGYDYVFGTGIAPGNSSGWQGWDGSTGGQTFAWVTGNQKAVATIDSSVQAMSLNLRHDDNTTEFLASTTLSDIVDSIMLVG